MSGNMHGVNEKLPHECGEVWTRCYFGNIVSRPDLREIHEIEKISSLIAHTIFQALSLDIHMRNKRYNLTIATQTQTIREMLNSTIQECRFFWYDSSHI
jgi:hypothetical protein